MDNILTLREVADTLKLSVRTIKRLVSTGQLKGFKVGGVWRFQQSDVEALFVDGSRARTRRGK